MTTNSIPHVHSALLEVTKKIEVEPDGTLPGNMGGKGYASATAVANHVKQLFVSNELILVANEEVVTSEQRELKERITQYIVVRGEYQIVSVKDGSTVTISAIGNGQATGTAVAANIASTFALKNALLRTFMISDQSAEDAGMAEPGEKKASRLEKSVKATTPRRTTSTKSPGSGARDKIKTEFIETGKISPKDANARIQELKKNGHADPETDLLEELRKEFK